MEESGKISASRLITDAVQRVLEQGGIGALATVVAGPGNIGSKLLIEQSGEVTGSLGDPALDQAISRQATSFLESRAQARALLLKEFAPEVTAWANTRVFFERIRPEPRMVICGAGHVGAALAKLAGLIGYRATLIDDRAEFVTSDRFPNERIKLIAAENWTDAVRQAVGNGRGVSVAVVTRGHNEDEECMRALIATDADYIGLIGSKRRTNIVLDRLRQAGADEEKLRKVRAPIGLDIGAVTPEEVALAILAEIVADRRGGHGGLLSAWRRGHKSS
jgi:xanthine dehydrogenase accessory factor